HSRRRWQLNPHTPVLRLGRIARRQQAIRASNARLHIQGALGLSQALLAGAPVRRAFTPYDVPRVMSALPPKADMCGVNRNVRFGPKADIGTSITFRLTFAGRLRNRLSALIAHIREMVFQASLDTAAPRPNVCAILFNVRSA